MRCFVAVDLDDRLKLKVVEIQKRLERIGDIKLVESENLHFTLKFLGEVTEQQLDEAKYILEKIADSFQPFEINIKNLGAFPSLNYMRVIWLGAPELYSLQKAVDDSFYPKFPKEKEVIPHMTLARVRSPKGKDLLAEFIKNSEDIEIGGMKVGMIKLKKSALTPRGPVYDDVAVLELGR